MRGFCPNSCLVLLILVTAAVPAGADPGAPGLPPAPTPTDHLPPAPGTSSLFAGSGLRQAAAGTGFFVAGDGALVTNHHVVTDCSRYSIETTDGTESAATLIDSDPTEDLALLRVPGVQAAPVTFRRAVTWDGRRIAVIGYPSFGMQRIKPFLAEGALTGPSSPNGHRFQFEADVRHGNSGGPIFDGAGLVVGVVFAKIDTAAVYRDTGRKIQDVGFAISNETTRAFLEKHGIEPAMAESAPPQNTDAVLAAAQHSLARVLCWRPDSKNSR